MSINLRATYPYTIRAGEIGVPARRIDAEPMPETVPIHEPAVEPAAPERVPA
jgi:hypothetical protein